MSLHIPGWTFEPLERPEQVDAFWSLCTDEYILRYLMDGERLPREWAAEATRTSAALFAAGTAGLWLATRDGQSTPSGFTGFWSFEELGPEPQLLYALLESQAGAGHATRFAEALVDWARRERVFADIVSAVDAPNHASIRVLRKIGFLDDGDKPGAFGPTHMFRLPAGRPPLTMHTERLILRPWRDDDRAAFAAMNADPEVMRYFPATLSREQSDEFAAKAQALIEQNGWGLWAVEAPGVAPFVGFVGLAKPTFDAPFLPATEIGWRLAREFWGRGYATEAARRVLDAAFLHIGLDEVISMTTVTNGPSRRVMEKLGMRRDPSRDFDHPRIPEGHELRPHVLYAARSSSG